MKQLSNFRNIDESQILEDRGWIKVLNWKAKSILFITAPGRKKIPQCQKKAIADICIEAGIRFPDELE